VNAAALADATTPEELDARMRALVAAGARCTYVEACYHVPPKLRARVGRFFDSDGVLRDPDGPGDPFASLSAVIETFHEHLASLGGGRPVMITAAESAEVVVAEVPVEPVGPPRSTTPVAVPDTRFLCPICDKRVDAEPVVFRGASMCPQCIGKLRGF
jgi:hypothetical protein